MPAKRKASLQLIFRGKVFSVQRHEVTEPGGMRVVRDLVHHPGSAVILPVLSDRNILMVRQYRLAAGASLWELPAGTIDPGETPLQTARRELTEETGYRATRWRKLSCFYPSPGLMTERMHLFLAQDLRPGSAHPESDERILARSFALPELLHMARSGKIVDGKSLVGLLYWAQWSPIRAAPRK